VALDQALTGRGKKQSSRIGIALALSLIISLGLSRQTPHLEITPHAVLFDERFRIALNGLNPREEVTIRADGNRGRVAFERDLPKRRGRSRGGRRSDEAGVVRDQ
jgi:hypothetical protein